MSPFRHGAIAIAALTAALAVGGTAPSAAAADDGLWYYGGLGVPEAQAQGLTGKGVTIGVVGEPIKADAPSLSDADLHVREPSFCAGGSTTTDDVAFGAHTTNVLSFLAGNGTWYDGQSAPRGVAPGARIDLYVTGTSLDAKGNIVCKGKKDKGAFFTGDPMAQAIRQAVADGCDIISISQGTEGGTSPDLTRAIADALHHDVIVVAATPDYRDQAEYPSLPTWLNGVLGVNMMDSSLQLATEGGRPIISPEADVAAPGVRVIYAGAQGDWRRTELADGTSFATPITAGVLALVKQRYPSATNNQVLQSLTRNTGLEDHSLTYSQKTGFGYGVLSLRHLLRVDPTTYPDVNPLVEQKGAFPSPKMIAENPPDPGVATASPAPARASDDSGRALPVGPIAAIAAGVLVLAGAAVAITLVLARRRRTATENS